MSEICASLFLSQDGLGMWRMVFKCRKIFYSFPVLLARRRIGKIDSWKDALLCVGIGILLFVVIGGFYILGSKIPKKDA